MKGSHLFTTGPQRNRLAAFKDRDRVNSSVTSEIPVHHKNHLQFWTCQHLSKQRQVSTSAVQELRGKKKNLSKDSSTCNSCTILKIKYFKLVCKSFVGFFFFYPHWAFTYRDKISLLRQYHSCNSFSFQTHTTSPRWQNDWVLHKPKNGILKRACLFFLTRKERTANTAKGEDLVKVRQRLKC